LGPRERAVYELVARRYLAQFYEAHVFLQTTATLAIGEERFRATGRQVVVLGWKALAGAEGEADDDEKEKDGAAKEALGRLPTLRVGDEVTVAELVVGDKVTEPPKPFDDASLIAAMCGVAKFVRNPAVQKILSEADGIGTPATRAAIVETLF